jgi:UDP-N-acetylmuramoylalanine--D-glutamate ligase
LRPETRVPHIGVITSFSPNHLDWHANMDEYAAAKRILFERQRPGDFAIVNPHDKQLTAMLCDRTSNTLPLVNDIDLPHLLVPGWHNRMNAVCAATAAIAAGCSREAVERGLCGFRGLPQRMELIAEIEGRAFYNDSASTAPESTNAALESLDQPTWLLAGGHDKGFDFTAMIEAIGRRAAGAAFYGEIGPNLCERLTESHTSAAVVSVPTLRDALEWCWIMSNVGDAIVLSPGCSSHDQFRNFRERGERFTELVRQLT